MLSASAAHQSLIGIEVRRLSGERLYAINADKLFTPASVVKLATSYAALRHLGRETRFKTELLSASPIVEGQLTGDVWLKGHGDPTLDHQALDALAGALSELGINQIDGDLVADASLFEGPAYPPGWMWDDLRFAFAAPVSALRLAASGSVSLEDAPERQVVLRLQERLAAMGITLAGSLRVGQAPPDATVLARHDSPTVGEIVRLVNKDSNNLYAETLVRQLGVRQASGSHAAGMAVLRETLGEVGWTPDTYRLADGSGLSRYDAVTPSQMTRLLLAASRMPEAPAFMTSLPVAGRDGTLATRMRGTRAEGVVWAKTGTMSGVSSLCGYVMPPGQEPLAFAVMVNGFVGSAKPIQELQDALLDALVAIGD